MSIHRLRLGEFPCAVQDFGARTIEAYHVIPARHGRQAVGDLAVAAAEPDGDRAVRAFLRGDTIQRIGVVRVPLQVTLVVVDDDRPKAVDENFAVDGDSIDGISIVIAGCDVEIERVFFGIAAICHRCSDQVSYRIDLLLRPNMRFVSGSVAPNTSSASRILFWLA
jgi:hypothetical protein